MRLFKSLLSVLGFVLLVVSLFFWGWADVGRAQNTDETHRQYTAIQPGTESAIIHRAAEPLAVNLVGDLIDKVGKYVATLWSDPGEYAVSLRVTDSIAPDTMQVRVRSWYVREKIRQRYALNYIDTLVSGRRQEFPSARGANTGWPAGSMLIVASDLSGSTVGDSTVIYLNRYGGVSYIPGSFRTLSYYGSVSSTVPDTGATLTWGGMQRLSFSIKADDDSLMVRILARIYNGGWGSADYILEDSTEIDTSLWTQTTMARDSIPPGDSLQVIVVPLTGFSGEPGSFSAVVRGEY